MEVLLGGPRMGQRGFRTGSKSPENQGGGLRTSSLLMLLPGAAAVALAPPWLESVRAGSGSRGLCRPVCLE